MVSLYVHSLGPERKGDCVCIWAVGQNPLLLPVPELHCSQSQQPLPGTLAPFLLTTAGAGTAAAILMGVDQLLVWLTLGETSGAGACIADCREGGPVRILPVCPPLISSLSGHTGLRCHFFPCDLVCFMAFLGFIKTPHSFIPLVLTSSLLCYTRGHQLYFSVKS